jgi:mediator of RNA polymerase II transcription subunit 31
MSTASTEAPSIAPAAAVTAAAAAAVTANNNGTTAAAAARTPSPPANAAANNNPNYLPEKRFELELEFVQALASPAYLHFLATSRVDNDDAAGQQGGGGGGGGLLLQDLAFQNYLNYLYRTWSRPEYSRYLSYPHCLYFLQLLLIDVDRSSTCSSSGSSSSKASSAILKEWTVPVFRNFCHQQQFMSWQHRHEVLYGKGGNGSTDTDEMNTEGLAPSVADTNTAADDETTTAHLELDAGNTAAAAAVAPDTNDSSTAPDRSS